MTDMTEHHLEQITLQGYTILENVLSDADLATTRAKIDGLLDIEIERFGREELLRIRELGTLRFMMAEDKHFLTIMNQRPVMTIIEALLSPNCILHLQNGIVLFPAEQHQQAAWHQDYRRWMGGLDVSFNAFFMIDDFTTENGGTLVVPGTHLSEERPSDDYLNANKVQITGKAGSVLIFNSRVWHAGGSNLTDKPRRAINHQYTYSYIRQQVDYAHCLPEDDYADLPDRIQQLLGRYVRLPKSIFEFRVPAAERLHRSGQD